MGSSSILLEAGGCKWGCEGGAREEGRVGEGTTEGPHLHPRGSQGPAGLSIPGAGGVTPSQMGEEHLQKVRGALPRWAQNTHGWVQVCGVTFACMGFLRSRCPGNLKGLLFGFGVCVPIAEKMEQRQIF